MHKHFIFRSFPFMHISRFRFIFNFSHCFAFEHPHNIMRICSFHFSSMAFLPATERERWRWTLPVCILSSKYLHSPHYICILNICSTFKQAVEIKGSKCWNERLLHPSGDNYFLTDIDKSIHVTASYCRYPVVLIHSATAEEGKSSITDWH